ncbi:RNA-dependent RNA polymerase, putative [Ophiostoma mitovirus 6]|uniref:RNA-dependent RNA polymerase, putative n=1 Tax=Ophiostoma mitovirus 6 TaxID=88389 RepID=Q9WJ24_9VIRU|nr:RNA-dependent RNA polymerase, putative [Ophiostoma mitovirus 6]CAB42654.1 RNA-dependent RNA polymerase, putative [Ophiostoma mitovirus 6]
MKLKQLKLMKNKTYQIIRILLIVFFPSIKRQTVILNIFMSKINKMIKNNGTLFTVKYLKELRLHITKYISGEPYRNSLNRVSVDKDGFPTLCKELKVLVNGTYLEKRFVLTIITLSKLLIPQKSESIPFSTKSITDHWSGIDNISNEELDKSCSELNISTREVQWDVKNFKLLTKAGPHGPQSLTWYHTIKLYDFNQWLGIIGILPKSVLDLFTETLSYASKLVLPEIKSNIKSTKLIRRLSIVHDPECKERVIAIFDYGSQMVLKPIADVLFDLLRNIPSDRTFTQSPFFTHTDLDNKSKFWSIDLSSATDRFPIVFQKRVLQKILGKQMTDSWERIMIGSKFLAPDGDTVSYNCGQPMGAQSSWPMFTLAHHVIVRVAANRCGLSNFDKYIILGDDIVINNDNVALKYMEIMNDFKVEISRNKTHVSNDTYEFAKRWIKNKMEFFPLPIRGIVDNINNKYIIFNILYSFFVEKGNTFLNKDTLLVCVSKFIQLHSLTLKKPIGLNKVKGILYPFNFMLRYRQNLCTNEEIRIFLGSSTCKRDDYMLPISAKDVSLELTRVISAALVGMAYNAEKSLKNIYFDLDKLSPWIGDGFKTGKHPKVMIQSIYNSVKSLSDFGLKMAQNKLTLSAAMDSLLLVDLDSISSSERIKYIQMKQNICLSQKVRKELRFDPLQMEQKARAMMLVKHMKDLEG